MQSPQGKLSQTGLQSASPSKKLHASSCSPRKGLPRAAGPACSSPRTPRQLFPDQLSSSLSPGGRIAVSAVPTAGAATSRMSPSFGQPGKCVTASGLPHLSQAHMAGLPRGSLVARQAHALDSGSPFHSLDENDADDHADAKAADMHPSMPATHSAQTHAVQASVVELTTATDHTQQHPINHVAASVCVAPGNDSTGQLNNFMPVGNLWPRPYPATVPKPADEAGSFNPVATVGNEHKQEAGVSTAQDTGVERTMHSSLHSAMGLPTAQELAVGWSGFKGLLGGMVNRVAAFPATLQAMRAAQREQETSRGDAHGEGLDEDGMTPEGRELEALAQEVAESDAQQLVMYLRSEDPNLVQGALVIMMDYLLSQRLSAGLLLEAGIAPVLAELIGPTLCETTSLALEALAGLLNAWDRMPSQQEDEAVSTTVAPLLHVMHVCLGYPVPPTLQYAHVLQPEPVPGCSKTVAAEGKPLPSDLNGLRHRPAEEAAEAVVLPGMNMLQQAIRLEYGGDQPIISCIYVPAVGSAPSASKVEQVKSLGSAAHEQDASPSIPASALLIRDTEERYQPWANDQPRRTPNASQTSPQQPQQQASDQEQGQQLNTATRTADAAAAQQKIHVAFFAASAATRLARFPMAGRLLVRGYVLPLLCAGLTAPDVSVRQVCLCALYKLVHVGSHADNLVAVLHAGGAHALRSLMTGGMGTSKPTVAKQAAQVRTPAVNKPVRSGDWAAPASGAAVVQALAEAMASRAAAAAQTTVTDAGVTPGSATSTGQAMAGVENALIMSEVGTAATGTVPVRDMAAALLLDLALLPEAPAHAADYGLVASLVQLLDPECDPASRMYGLLVLARLANHSPEVQLDSVREGAVSGLVSMMRNGGEDEKLHAARLIAILAQSQPAHETLRATPVMAALSPLLRSKNPLVVEHSASVFAIMANNPDTHFQIVGWGVVPLLVALLARDHASAPQQAAGSGKMQTYVLATLLLLSMHEPRHADVVCRSGAVPHLVRLVRGHGVRKTTSSANVREYAAAVISCLCRNVDVQMEVIHAGGVPALVQLLTEGGMQAHGHAAEALVQMATVEQHRARLTVRACDILPAVQQLLCSDSPASRYWAAALLRMTCLEKAVLDEVCDMPALLSALVTLLEDQSTSQAPEARRAQVQAAWVLTLAIGSRPDLGASLSASSGLVRSLVLMLAAGWESVQRGAGGALHVPLVASDDGTPGGGAGGAGLQAGAWRRLSVDGGWAAGGSGDNGAASEGGGSASAPTTPRAQRRLPLRIEPLDSNGHAAAVAALLALAQCSEEVKEEIEREVIFQGVWCGQPVRLEGLYFTDQ